jgi:hypothetical protein
MAEDMYGLTFWNDPKDAEVEYAHPATSLEICRRELD